MGTVPAAEKVDRVERVTNLLLVLLEAKVPLTLEYIVHTVGGYPASHDAYRQAFERDKRLLREQGIDVRVEEVPGSEVLGYRIDPDDYYLPDLELTAEEQQALNLALAGVAIDEQQGQGAAWKLGVADSLRSLQSAPLAALPSAPALPVLHEAIRSKRAVSFRHRGADRTVEPYGLLFRRGFWYVVGHDRDREAKRSFRIDRIDGAPVVLANQTFEAPANFDPASAFPEDTWRIGEGEPVTARVIVDRLHAGMVESELGSAAVTERRDDGSVVVEMEVVSVDNFRSWVLGLLDHAVVLSPDELRSVVVEWLTPLAEAR
jgi:proteasome accessory factor B